MGWSRRFARPYWNIGVVRAPVTRLLDPQYEPQIEWLEPLKGYQFMADPFGIVANGRRYVFCERYDFRVGKGDIVYFELDENLKLTPPKSVIALEHHASYPFIFEHGGTYYCVPETYQAREVALYAATGFPQRWARVATLLANLAANDSSLIHYKDRWWLFCTDYDRGFDSALCIFHAQSLVGPYEPHAKNPVKLDNASACSAGALFTYENNLYRPAQDCSRGYGERTVILRIDELTPDAFTETPVRTVTPDPQRYTRGLHTLSPLGEWTLVDGLSYRVEADAVIAAMRHSVGSGARRVGVPEAVLQAAKRAIG